MQVYYFAWIREKVGTNHEEIETAASTVQDLIDELVVKGDNYSSAFSNLGQVKVAVDKVFIDNLNYSIKKAKEVAFFPPVTGG